MTFALLGGISVYLVPNTVLTVRMVQNVQSMLHHGIQIITGVYTAAYYRRRLNRRFFLSGFCLFTLLFAVANLLNTVGYDFLLSRGFIEEGDSFNMFYISPRADQKMPMFEDFLSGIHPAVTVIGYFVLVTVGALILILSAKAIFKFSRKNKRGEL